MSERKIRYQNRPTKHDVEMHVPFSLKMLLQGKSRAAADGVLTGQESVQRKVQ